MPGADSLHTAVGCLSAVWLFGCGAFSAYAIAANVLPRAATATRAAASMTVALWLAQVIFHLLASLGWFNLPAALVVGSVLAVALKLAFRGSPALAWAAHHDRQVLARSWRKLQARKPSAPGLFAAVALLVVGRSIVMPVLGWDTLVYHAVKPALWVQTGQYEAWNPPGGWSIFLLHPAASEVLVAWAMLPFHGDLLAGVDGFVWLGLGLAVVALARRLGVTEPYATTAAAAVLAVPTARLLVGSGYVELASSLALVLSLFFALGFLRRGLAGDLWLACAALGVLAATKVTMAVPAGLVGLFLIARAVANWRGRAAVPLLVGVGVAGLAHLPWLARNVRLTGYPLDPLPLRVAGLTLGRANEAVNSLAGMTAGLPAWDWAREARIVKALFVVPGVYDVGLGLLTAIPLLVAVPATWWLARREWRSALLLLLVCAAFVALYFSRELLYIRMYWTTNSARFLLPAVCVAVPLSVVWCRAHPAAGRLYHHVLWACSAFYLIWFAVAGWTAHDARGVLGLIALAAAGMALARLAGRRGRRVAIVAALAATLGVALTLNAYKQANRYQAVVDSAVFDGTNRYWWPAARALDQDQTGQRIAMTSGPHSGGVWFPYYFLGARFQNRIDYVSPAASGAPTQFPYAEPAAPGASLQAWTARLRSAGITHVMSFRPPSLELRWMEQHPEQFVRVEGAAGSWGLFALGQPTGNGQR